MERLEIYPASPNAKYPYDRVYIRDTADELEQVREIVKSGRTLLVCNAFDTFYGSGWGRWLEKGVEDIANIEVVDTSDAWGYCSRAFPIKVLLTPKAAQN